MAQNALQWVQVEASNAYRDLSLGKFSVVRSKTDHNLLHSLRLGTSIMDCAAAPLRFRSRL